jgi:hypothetical protein
MASAMPDRAVAGACLTVCSPQCCVIRPTQSLCFYGHTIINARPKGRLAQPTHDVVSFFVILRHFVQTCEIDHTPALGDAKF